MLNTIIIQPPLVQLNTPYPSGAYLKAFFKKIYSENNIDGTIDWFDFSTELFHKVFCREGLKKIFQQSQEKALKIAADFENNGDDNSAFQIRKFISESPLWCEWIDKIISVLCENTKISGREFTHEFVRSAHAPRGDRMERYLSKLERDVSVDDSRIIASLALADLADYITIAYDRNFALIRYAEHLATSTSTFDSVEENLSSPILENFLNPLIKEKIPEITEQTLVLVSIPFPGTFESALYTAKYLRNTYGDKITVAMGGGYVNTELRTVSEKKLFKYCHFLSYDKGYGSYMNLFDQTIKENGSSKNIDFKKILDGRSFYKIKYLLGDNLVEPLENHKDYEKKEKEMIYSLIPDFSTLDYSRSPRLADSDNPMHRIWNDGSWLKIYMAYGCYWHRCAFCDTSLDYVNDFCNTNIHNLYDGIYQQCKNTGVYGIHFVDEACPPVAMQEFALKNIVKSKDDTSLTYWGNIRFEKTFTRDLADLLSYGGLTAVSGGIEIATGDGLDMVNKGTDMENIVAACCAFKETGILTHSYMIYGFWNQSEQDLINSMETLRQLFESGLLDSAFFHKFTLTLHSTVYREWKEGKHPDLHPIEIPKQQFAENDIHFKGEEKSEKYTAPLMAAVDNWMNGNKLKKSVDSYFPFKMPKTTIKPGFVESLIAKYEQKRDKAFRTINPKKPCVWIGGKMMTLKSGNQSQLCWSYMGELLYADISKAKAQETCDFINSISAMNYEKKSEKFITESIIQKIGKELFLELRGQGLCALI